MLGFARTGDADIIDRLYFYEDADGTVENQSWSYSKWGGTTDNNATNRFTSKTIKKMVWKSEAGKSTVLKTTITSISWQLKTIKALKGTDITVLPFKNWSADGDNDATVTGDVNSWECAKNFNTLTSTTIFGGDGIGGSKRYVDLTDYKKLIIRGYGVIRLFYNWHQKTGSETEDVKPMEYIVIDGTEVQTYEFDIEAFMTEKHISHFHLVGVKGNGNCFVESISVLDGTETADYYISGVGYQLPSVAAALADATVTSYDVTGLTTTSTIELMPTNPNSLFVTNGYILSNDHNVIVNGTCTNLMLKDGYPYKAPVGFTAENATFVKTVTAAGFATMVIPFAATLPDDVEAYNLTDVSGTTITATEATSIAANQPVLLKNAGDYTFTAKNVTISATAEGMVQNGLLYGIYTPTTAAAGTSNYVLQNSPTNGVSFFKVTGTAAQIKPFRAYLHTSSPAPVLYIDLDGDVTSVSEEFKVKNETTATATWFTLDGRKLNGKPTKKGFYIIDGRKVVIK